MPVSRGRKPKSEKSRLSQPQNPRQTPHQYHKSRWEKIRDHPIPWILGVIAAVLAIGEPIHQAFVEPDISFDGNVDISSPFSALFSVNNRSWLFAMNGAALNCVFESVIAGRVTFDNVVFVGRQATIKPGNDGAFRCLLGSSSNELVRITPANLTSAHIFLSMTYTILWVIQRNSTPTEFTWYTQANPPRWIRGVIAN
jgi:hypothetical protein